MNLNKKYERKYVSPTFKANDSVAVKKYFDELNTREITNLKALEKWIYDWEELGSIVHDSYSKSHVKVTVDTTDSKAETEFMQLVTEILPLIESEGFKLSKKCIDSVYCKELPTFYDLFIKGLKTDIDLFRKENIPLKIEERKLDNEFEKIMGCWIVNFRGQEMTMQQVARYLEDPIEATRKEAFEARIQVRLQDSDKLTNLYGRMLELRQKIAKNAGFKNYRDYQFKSYHRYDYTPQDCIDFHQAIEKAIVPLVTKMNQDKCKKLNIRTLTPWNTEVDPEAKQAITPFKNTNELIDGCERIFDKVDAEISAFFKHMKENKLLDLDSRKGKAPGGYCTQFSEDRVPFIFMNAAGSKRDVDTLLHEGGHSFHYYFSREIPLSSYHHTGLEFAEVASMSMELLSRPYFNEFYKGDEIDRVRRDQLKKILEFFPFMAMIDAFQHWVYETNTIDPKEWNKKWAELSKRFKPDLDWTGFENVRDIGWQYPHIFTVPFYYVEYGIAQLGALSIWKTSLDNHKKAVELYKNGLRLGATKPLPELFSSIGAKFGMKEEIIAPLVSTVKKEIGLQ